MGQLSKGGEALLGIGVVMSATEQSGYTSASNPTSPTHSPHSPYNRKRERGIYMNKQRGDFIRVMEYEAVAPGNDGAREGAVREAVARNEQRGVRGEQPDVDEVEDGAIVAEVEKEVVPGALLVVVGAHGEQVSGLEGVRDVHISAGRVSGQWEAR